jgi:thiosulfate/3-mercaptopyruvate sulfurtransferase
VLYGDNNNWFAAWAFWQLKIYRHGDVRIMDGGRRKWVEECRALTTDAAVFEASRYEVGSPDLSLRAYRYDIVALLGQPGTALVDVRSPQEFRGEAAAPSGLEESCQRKGHIPGAVNIPWAHACEEDGTFKSPASLRSLYERGGITPGKQVITYCRIGERSAHTWFVLKYLLGYENVANYDGSWCEWGNLIGAPVATHAD